MVRFSPALYDTIKATVLDPPAGLPTDCPSSSASSRRVGTGEDWTDRKTKGRMTFTTRLPGVSGSIDSASP